MNSLILFTLLLASPIQDSPLPPNLFKIADLKGIRREAGLYICNEELEGQPCLKIVSVNAQRPDPSIYFATLSVKPAQYYSFMIRAEAHAQSAHFVSSPAGNLVWPGAAVSNGVSVSTFKTPDNVSEITVALAFLEVKDYDYLLIKDIALFEGGITAEQWSSNENEGLSPILKKLEAERSWPRILFVGVSVLLVLLVILKRIRVNKRQTANA